MSYIHITITVTCHEMTSWFRPVTLVCCVTTLLSAIYLMDFSHDEQQPPLTSIAFASFLSFQGFEGCYTAPYFMDAVAKLGVSLKRTARRMDMLLLIVDAPCRRLFSMQRLRDIGWQIVWVRAPIWYTPKSDERGWSWIAGNRYEHTSQLSKLLLWNLTQYRHILYMDSDILLFRDPMQYVSPLLPYARSASLGMDQCDTICDQATRRVCNTTDCCAGSMLITPSAHELQRMLSHLDSVSFDREYQEQSFLQNYWTPQYNRTIFGFPREFIATSFHHESVGAFHFISIWKPWAAPLAQHYPSISKLWAGYCGYASCM